LALTHPLIVAWSAKRPRVSSPSESADEDGFFKDVVVAPVVIKPSKPTQKDRTRDVDEFFGPASEREGKKHRQCLACKCVDAFSSTANLNLNVFNRRRGPIVNLVTEISTLRRHIASYHRVRRLLTLHIWIPLIVYPAARVTITHGARKKASSLCLPATLVSGRKRIHSRGRAPLRAIYKKFRPPNMSSRTAMPLSVTLRLNGWLVRIRWDLILAFMTTKIHGPPANSSIRAPCVQEDDQYCRSCY
jgi:hypothetical protein